MPWHCCAPSHNDHKIIKIRSITQSDQVHCLQSECSHCVYHTERKLTWVQKKERKIDKWKFSASFRFEFFATFLRILTVINKMLQTVREFANWSWLVTFVVHMKIAMSVSINNPSYSKVGTYKNAIPSYIHSHFSLLCY